MLRARRAAARAGLRDAGSAVARSLAWVSNHLVGCRRAPIPSDARGRDVAEWRPYPGRVLADHVPAGDEAGALQVDRPDQHHHGRPMVTIDGSIVLIAMPAIFRGIGLDPLLPGNSFYLLWMILGFLVVTSVLVVSLGRLGDMYGRVRIYNLGFAIFTFFSLMLTVTWMPGRAGAIFLIVDADLPGRRRRHALRQLRGDPDRRLPANQRGMALGINGVAATSGTFIGLVVGGLLAPIDWRLIFLVSVPIGLFCTIWAYTDAPRHGAAPQDEDRLGREHHLRGRV